MWELFPPKIRLTGRPQPGAEAAANLAKDFERFRGGLPRGLESYILGTYGINLAGVYGGHAIKNPFGKASGQLSLVRHQVEKDAEAGLGFVILKTLIAQDSTGEQSMHEWAIPETRLYIMVDLSSNNYALSQVNLSIPNEHINQYIHVANASRNRAIGVH